MRTFPSLPMCNNKLVIIIKFPTKQHPPFIAKPPKDPPSCKLAPQKC